MKKYDYLVQYRRSYMDKSWELNGRHITLGFIITGKEHLLEIGKKFLAADEAELEGRKNDKRVIADVGILSFQLLKKS